MRFSSALSAFVFSAAFCLAPAHAQPAAPAATASATTAPSLFGWGIELHPKGFVHDGTVYVGFPSTETEALLYVLEKQIPLMKGIIKGHETLDTLKDTQIKTATTSLAMSEGITEQAFRIADAWKEAAKTPDMSLWDAIFDSNVTWFGLGVALTVGIIVAYEGVRKD